MDDLKTSQNIRPSICEQLKKLEDDTTKTASSNFAVAQIWERWNTLLGLGIILISGLVTTIGALLSATDKNSHPLFSNQHAFLIASSTMLASFTAVVGSILTFLKPSERASRYREFGNKQKSLRNRIRVYRSVSVEFAADLNDIHRCLQEFLAEKDALNSDNPPIPRWAYKVTTKDRAKSDEESHRA